jgi:D-amino peptidase
MTKKISSAFISVDIEGVTGVAAWEETQRGTLFNGLFRKIMADETNVAIEALLEAGAEKIYVKDAHGDGRNFNPSDLHEEAFLIRGHTMGPDLMMAMLSSDFDAVLFIGYHGKPGTQDSPMHHFFSTDIFDCRINGVSMSEGTFNSLIAGYYDVPVIFLSGDKAACDDILSHIENIETVAVKEGFAKAVISRHPTKSQEMIKAGVKRAIEKIDSIRPFKIAPPYKIEVQMARPEHAINYKMFPGAMLEGSRTVVYETDDLREAIVFTTAFGAKFM